MIKMIEWLQWLWSGLFE